MADCLDGSASFVDCLLLENIWPEMSTELDLIAAHVLVIGDDLAEGVILLGNNALTPPHLRGLGLRVGDVGPRQRAGGRKPERTAEYRTSSQIGRSNFPYLFAPRIRGHVSVIDLQPYYRTVGCQAQT